MDRRTLLDQTDKARRAMNNQDLPPHIRSLAKKAVDHGELALLLQDSLKQPRSKQATAPCLSAPPKTD